jgi:hypothetical protein
MSVKLKHFPRETAHRAGDGAWESDYFHGHLTLIFITRAESPATAGATASGHGVTKTQPLALTVK